MKRAIFASLIVAIGCTRPVRSALRATKTW
jgi:hypothetical protein